MSIEYAYDKNGNLSRDDNKGMTFTCDLLGHPLAIAGSDNQTDYVYSADGRKLRATHTQGNNRILIGSNGQRDQYSHYYPYGGLMGDISTNDAHSYKYGGKELDRDFGIDLFDFEARQYDAKLPAFTSIDPLAEKYYSISPYAYCAGDPVNLVDPTGKDVWTIEENGNVQRDTWNEMDVILYKREGKYVAKSYFEYGTVDGYSTKDGGYVSNFGNNESAAIEVFETSADNSNVEWGLIEAYDRKDGSSVNNVATSCSPVKEKESTNSVNISQYYIVKSRHSHPSGNPVPSGIRDGDTHGDKFAAKQIESFLPPGEICSFAVYVPKGRIKQGINFHDKVDGGYYFYNGSTSYISFYKQYLKEIILL